MSPAARCLGGFPLYAIYIHTCLCWVVDRAASLAWQQLESHDAIHLASVYGKTCLSPK
jgi:hypothetical protein